MQNSCNSMLNTPKMSFSTNLEDLIEKYDYFLFDCDGVLWTGNNEIEGAFDGLRKIQ